LRRRPWGYVVVGAGLVLWVVESLTIGVDQWMGHAADPSSSTASAAIAPVLVAQTIDLWEVPDAPHAGTLATRPGHWEARVTRLLHAALGPIGRTSDVPGGLRGWYAGVRSRTLPASPSGTRSGRGE
jgi:hypothetical protein